MISLRRHKPFRDQVRTQQVERARREYSQSMKRPDRNKRTTAVKRAKSALWEGKCASNESL